MKVNSVAPSTVYDYRYSNEKTKEAVTNNEEVTNEVKKTEDKVATTVKAASDIDKDTGKNIDIYA